MQEQKELVVDSVRYPYTVYVERRSAARASITSRGITIRVPRHFNSFEREREINSLVSWVKQKLTQKPFLVHTPKFYQHGDLLRTHSRIYELHIEHRDSVKNFAKVSGNRIVFKIAHHYSSEKQQDYIAKQLRRLLAAAHAQELHEHVHTLNRLHFHKELGSVSYSYTKSRWGACATHTKDINLSTRLLLAPREILEYVIIHELAHLFEANHSPRFWNIVKSVDPHYKQKKKWLRDYGHLLVI